MTVSLRRAVLVLAAVELLAFGVFLPRLGFYSDDWAFLEFRGSGSLADCFRGVAAAGYWTRPVHMLQLPLWLWAGGVEPWRHHVLLMGLKLLEGVLFFLLLRRLTRDDLLALTAAGLSLLFPVRPASHLWSANSPQGFALTLTLGAMVAHLRWLEHGGRRRLAASQTLYLASLLSYESCAFLPLVLLARDGVAGGRRRLAELAPFAGTLAVGLAWQWGLVPLLTGADNPKSAAPGLGFAVEVYRRGLAGLTWGAARDAWLSGGELVRHSGIELLAGLAAAGAAASAVLARSAPDRRPLPAAWRAAGFLFAAAYLPFAISGNYLPGSYGIVSRTNAAGALAGALAAAAAVASVRPRRTRSAVLALIGTAFLWTDWFTCLQWARSWSLQREFLAAASDAANRHRLPPGATLLLAGVPTEVNGTVVFGSAWDLDAALRLVTGRRDLRGDVLMAPLVRDGDDVVTRAGTMGERRYSLRRSFVLDLSVGPEPPR